MNSVYLSSPMYLLEREVKIAGSDVDPHEQKRLLSEECKLESFWVSDSDCYEMATELVKKLLQEEPALASEVDTVIFSTDSIDSAELDSRLTGFFTSTGLSNAFPIKVSMAECANFQAAANIAYSMVSAKQSNTSLVICVDRIIDQGCENGFLVGSFGAFSDSVACCIVSRERRPQSFEIKRGFHRTFKGQCLADDFYSDQNSLFKVMDITETLFAGAYQDWKVTADDINHLFVNNTTVSELEMLADCAEINSERCYQNNIARKAHCFSADSIINLCDSLEEELLSEDDLIVMMSSGRAHWGCFLIKYLGK